jgi:hypothetical protein
VAIRSTAHGLLATTSLTAPKRVSGHAIMVTASNELIKHVSGHAVMVTSAMFQPKRITGHYALIITSIDDKFELIRLESNSQIFDVESGFHFDYTLVAGQIPEINPYKPQVPESLINIPGTGRDLFDYIEENQKTLRLQHNITQAGDTTFPHEMIINSHDVRQFRLGAVGRFYHEDYGIIHARYVQYEKMDQTLRPTAPVGLIKNTGHLDWIVTNRLEISDPHLVVGVQAAYVMPKDGQFGWVTVDGVNLQPIVTEGDGNEIGTAYVWSASGKVGPDGEGIVVCRRLSDGGDVTLLRGRALIRLEGAGFGSIDVHYMQLLADVAKLKIDVELLTEASDVATTIATIQASLKTLGNRINSEQNARQSADAAINVRIDGLNAVTAAQLNAAISAMESELESVRQALSIRIDAVNDIALEALAKANQALAIDIGGIEAQITNILTLIADERIRPKGKFPLVDGAVPPNLVYLDDGTLVYEETF